MTEEMFESCVAQMCRGEQDGLKQIYEAYMPYIYSIIMCVLKNKEDAEDVAADFFLRLWNTADKYRPGNGHKAYMATIARNMAIDLLRKRGREVLYDMSEEYDEDAPAGTVSILAARQAAGDTEGFEQELINKISLKEALDTLKPSEREIINLKLYGGLTFSEISEILSCPMGTVTWRYREAIKKLRKFGFE